MTTNKLLPVSDDEKGTEKLELNIKILENEIEQLNSQIRNYELLISYYKRRKTYNVLQQEANNRF